MRYILFSLFVSFPFFLTGCATYPAQSALQSAASNEGTAWVSAESRAAAQCDPEFPIPAKRAVQFAKCYADIVRQSVKPVAMDPMRLEEYLLETQEISLAYQNGGLSWDQTAIELQKSWIAYSKNWDAEFKSNIARAYQADATRNAQTGYALQALGQAIMQANNPPAQASAPATTKTFPSFTSCRQIGSAVNCVHQ